MTRETKIGLLVGLAFIIVIGILLSDHFTSTTAPLNAIVTESAAGVRSSIRIPGDGTVTRPGIDISPAQEPNVPLQMEIKPESRAEVQIQPPTVIIPDPAPPAYGGGMSGGLRMPPGTGTFHAPEPLPDFVESQRSPFESAQGQNSTNEAAGDHETVAAPTAGTVATKAYKVQDGDTISKIARRMFGTDSKAAIDAIAKANPGMRDVHKITAGKTLNLPASLATEKKEPVTGGEVTLSPSGTVEVVKATEMVGKETLYTTKPGDTLWRIAVDQCGSPSLVKELKAINRDVLKGGETIRPNMKLKLPLKSVAMVE